MQQTVGREGYDNEAEKRKGTFFREAVIKSGLKERIVKKICKELTAVDKATLEYYVCFVDQILTHCPRTLNLQLVKSLSLVSEGYPCTEGDESTPANTRKTLTGILYVHASSATMFSSDTPLHPVSLSFTCHLNGLQLLPMQASSFHS